MKLKVVFYTTIIILFCYSCLNDRNIGGIFPREGESGIISKSIFKVNNDSFVRISECVAYYHEFNYWIKEEVGDNVITIFSICGYIFKKNNCIYLKPIKSDTIIKYFDFNLKIGNNQLIGNRKRFVKISDGIEGSVRLRLDDKFYDNNLHDTIYKFQFERLGIISKDDDLIFYIGKDVGVVGSYNSFFNRRNNSEEIFSYVGNIYRSRLSDRTIFIRNYK